MAGQDTKIETKIDIFEELGLRVAEGEYNAGNASMAKGVDWEYSNVITRQKRKGSDTPIPSFMQIYFRTSNLLSGADTNNKYKIFLPYDHEKTVQDTIQTRIENSFKSSGYIGTQVTESIQNFVTKYDGNNGLIKFLQNNTLFKYDAGSTLKSLQIPFVVPLGLATMAKLEGGAAKKVRKCFNVLQGLLYPQGSATFFPPLMELTMGGMYRSFYGFITSVTINPANPDMFQDPVTGEYFHLLYNGSITFQNLFTYYHESALYEGGENKFKIDNGDPDICVLFGKDALNTTLNKYPSSKNGSTAYMSDETAKAVDNILFTEHNNASRVVSIQKNATIDNAAKDAKNVRIALPPVFAYDASMQSYANSINNIVVGSSVYASSAKSINDELAILEAMYSRELSNDSTNAANIYQKYLQKARDVLKNYNNSFLRNGAN